MGTRIGFLASEKGAAEKECDVGLGLRMQTTANNTNTNNSTNKSLLSRKKGLMMSTIDTTPHHHHHHHNCGDDDDDEPPPTLLTATGGGVFVEEHGCDGGYSCSGPLLRNNASNIDNNNNNNNNNRVVVASMSDIYDVVGAADSGSLVIPLPPKSLLLPSSESLMSHNSSGVMVNANMRGEVFVPFTAAQRQELERQTMIYKYMMASIPVPPQLLIPISKSTPNFPHLHPNRSKGSLELGVSTGSDPEPWRCRRTDGKKWRCSRNVVPDQKYCERHTHKSRPRSRKPVEQQEQQQQLQLHSHFFNNTNANTNNNIHTSLLPYPKSSGTFLDQREKLQSPYSSSSTSHDQTRGLEWFLKGEEANSNQKWHQVVHVEPQQGRERAFDFYGEYGGGVGGNNQGLQSQGLSDQISSLIDPELVPNQKRHFIDAWSMAERLDHNNKYSVVSSNDRAVPYSSLTLSMQGGNGDTSEESENSQMGFGISEADLKCQWMNNNNMASWNGSASNSPPPPGGPLAEALCLGMAGSTRPTASSRSSS